MDEMLYGVLTRYYHALGLKGYMPYRDSVKMLVLIFLKDFVLHDFRGTLSKEDYHTIEKALDCLYGTTCLIPYPDYLKMGKLHLGEMTEIAQRVKNLEDTPVLKLIHDLDSTEGTTTSDVKVVVEESE